MNRSDNPDRKKIKIVKLQQSSQLQNGGRGRREVTVLNVSAAVLGFFGVLFLTLYAVFKSE